MKRYLGGIACGVLASIALAFLLKALNGDDYIGYSLESRILVGAIFGALVGALAGLPRLFNPRLFSSFLAMVFSGAVAGFVLWVAECLLLPGTNAGFSLFYALTALGLGSWVGLGMHIGNSWNSNQDQPDK